MKNMERQESTNSSNLILSSSNYNLSPSFDLSSSRSRSISNFLENGHHTTSASSSSASSKCSGVTATTGSIGGSSSLVSSVVGPGCRNITGSNNNNNSNISTPAAANITSAPGNIISPSGQQFSGNGSVTIHSNRIAGNNNKKHSTGDSMSSSSASTGVGMDVSGKSNNATPTSEFGSDAGITMMMMMHPSGFTKDSKNHSLSGLNQRELIYSRSTSNLIPSALVSSSPISQQPVSSSSVLGGEKISSFELRNYGQTAGSGTNVTGSPNGPVTVIGGGSSSGVPGAGGLTSGQTVSPGKYLEPEQINSYARQTLGSSSPYDRRRQIFFDRSIRLNRQESSADQVDGLVAMLSAFYCKILVVIGLCFPMAEVISHRIPIGWYEGFYLFLYTGSIVFLLFVYIFLLNRKRKPFTKLRQAISRAARSLNRRNELSTPGAPGTPSCADDCDTEASNKSSDQSSDLIDDTDSSASAQCGSFYLRVGAVAFGVGSMIYSGLEFGQFFELESKEHCYTIIYGLTPGLHMIFTFFQLYFIFMNSRVIIARHKLIARFGLMHMIATNICVWLHVLIQETKHQIMTMITTNNTNDANYMDHVEDMFEEKNEDYFDFFSVKPHRSHLSGTHQHPIGNGNMPVFSGNNPISTQFANGPLQPGAMFPVTISPQVLLQNITSMTMPTTAMLTTTTPQPNEHLPILHRAVRSLNEHAITHSECRRSNIIGELVTDASQFLFPCTIEYSLICAAILYIMWKGHRKQNKTSPHPPTSSLVHQKHHYQVDCAKAHKGLFTGILLMVICIISLILFFVFIKKEQYRNLAVFQAHFVELFIYCITAIAAVIAFFQIRELDYNQNSNVALDNILLMSAQTGLCIFTMFSIIGAQFDSQSHNTRLVLINASACLIQSTLQSVFILDASKRKARTSDQMRRKPGREMVTFLLVCNFSMWAINTLETRRADSKPVQLQFFGFWAWTIISHVTMPLTIFYRFHSTVCLCEVWKSTYKIKSEFI